MLMGNTFVHGAAIYGHTLPKVREGSHYFLRIQSADPRGKDSLHLFLIHWVGTINIAIFATFCLINKELVASVCVIKI